MKKIIVKIALLLLVFGIGVGVTLLYKNNKNKVYEEDESKQIKKHVDTISMMLETEANSGNYEMTTRSKWPTEGYTFNTELSKCEHGSELSWDDTNKRVVMSGNVSDKCYVYFDIIPIRLGYETILLDNGNGATTIDEAKANIEGRTTATTPNFANAATTNEGMYVATDDLGKSYYFRGAVNNNWIKFGKDSTGKDIYWRIIRINGDGTIRMIYSGTTAPTSDTAIVMTGENTQVSTCAFNSHNSDDPAYVGYMYNASQQHGNSTASTIKETLENWYKTTTLETDSATRKLVSQDQIFCNDRSATTSSDEIPGKISGSMSATTQYYYGAYIRLNTNKSPKLTCNTESDKFTVNTNNGNGALNYPVGLITADEVSMAGGVNDINNSSYYLYTNSIYWLGSPFEYYYFEGYDPAVGGLQGEKKEATEYHINSLGSLTGEAFFEGVGTQSYDVTLDGGVRPVISLSSSVKLSGNGTYNNIYEVS